MMGNDRQARNDDVRVRVETDSEAIRTLSSAANKAANEGRQEAAEEHLADAKEVANGMIGKWANGPNTTWQSSHAQAMAELIIAWQVVEEARPVVVPTDPSVR